MCMLVCISLFAYECRQVHYTVGIDFLQGDVRMCDDSCGGCISNSALLSLVFLISFLLLREFLLVKVWVCLPISILFRYPTSKLHAYRNCLESNFIACALQVETPQCTQTVIFKFITKIIGIISSDPFISLVSMVNFGQLLTRQ